jgi:hypothetical protein
MKIFGIGLSKTGTISLENVFYTLGYTSIHYPRPPLCPDLIEVMKKFDAGSDSSVAYSYKELDVAFPGSKFILTTRSLKSWLRSYKHFLSEDFQYVGDEIVVQVGLLRDTKFNKKTFRKGFIKHHFEVKEYFKNRPNDLLIVDFSKGDGWEKICKFLNKPISDIPFPYTNRSEYRENE